MATKFKKKLSSITQLTKNQWEDVGDKSANEMRKQVVNNKFFKSVPYTATYRKRKAARKAAPKGVSVSSTSSIPDLTLTGKTMQALRTTKATTKGAFFGWTGAITNIVEGNAKNKRDIRDTDLLNEVGKVSRITVEKFYNKNILKSNGRIKLPVTLKF